MVFRLHISSETALARMNGNGVSFQQHDDKLESMRNHLVDYQWKILPGEIYFQLNYPERTEIADAENEIEKTTDAIISQLKKEWLLLD
jgi:hypothetical protein